MLKVYCVTDVISFHWIDSTNVNHKV